MAMNVASDSCPVPEFPKDPIGRPAFERPIGDVKAPFTRDGSVITLPNAVAEGAEFKDPDVAKFLANLQHRCGAKPEILKDISVSTYVIESDYGPINRKKVFIVSDTKTKKVLSYHKENGDCILDMKKQFDDGAFIAIDNAARDGVSWEMREENGVRIVWVSTKGYE
jgi:hypothetical protein